MAVSINRVIADGVQFAGIEFCSTGDAAGESGTIIDIGTLSDADGSGNERVRIKSIKACVTSEDANGMQGACVLSWGGSGDVFCTIPPGYSEITINFEPTSGFNGDINYQLSGTVAATLRIKLEKLHGFPNTAAKFKNI